ncbi:MAG: type II toxin-antitoxin system VapC family toxin [Lewinellaceae bacterium]|nr:type II toxin-antitoxin system VapC family toxin [Phaeodactylibacter sp.]MCB9040051.1 type II toxin-antitoxin system VapC family toxin [Lewinellaceae bacterium]
MDYLLDTNILIIYSRESKVANNIESDHTILGGGNDVAVSIVTLGELNSLTKQFRYGEKRKNRIGQMLGQLYEIDINIREIIDRYGEIDAFSQGRLAGKALRDSSRNMGKNDIWIAATASVFDMTLVTTDRDFEHLDGVYLKLKYIDWKEYNRS